MRLYHQPRSRSTRVLWLAEEAGAPLDVVVIAREEKSTDDYRKMHPLGRSPAYVEDGGPVFESAALCLHLADRHPEAGLIAEPGSHERALQYQWCFFAMTELEAPLVDAARQMWKDSGEPDAAIVEAAFARFQSGATVVEAALDGGDYPRRRPLLGGRHRRREACSRSRACRSSSGAAAGHRRPTSTASRRARRGSARTARTA